MQIAFLRWCMDPKGRTPVSVDPTVVACTEHLGDAFHHAVTGENFPVATKIILKNKKEYVVQGALVDVVTKLNAYPQDPVKK
jgi:hypothetical protein